MLSLTLCQTVSAFLMNLSIRTIASFANVLIDIAPKQSYLYSISFLNSCHFKVLCFFFYSKRCCPHFQYFYLFLSLVVSTFKRSTYQIQTRVKGNDIITRSRDQAINWRYLHCRKLLPFEIHSLTSCSDSVFFRPRLLIKFAS